MKNLTTSQILGLILAVLGVLAASTTQLTDLFGPSMAKTVVTVATLTTSLLSSILVAVTGQSSQVRAVQDMPGITSITVNADANHALASLAVDPLQPKIAPTAGDVQAVRDIARNG